MPSSFQSAGAQQRGNRLTVHDLLLEGIPFLLEDLDLLLKRGDVLKRSLQIGVQGLDLIEEGTRLKGHLAIFFAEVINDRSERLHLSESVGDDLLLGHEPQVWCVHCLIGESRHLVSDVSGYFPTAQTPRKRVNQSNLLTPSVMVF